MSDQNPDKELSIDELKKVSGGIRAQGGGYIEGNDTMANQKGKKKISQENLITFEDEAISQADMDVNDHVRSFRP
jgi:bacteriocin-like protein